MKISTILIASSCLLASLLSHAHEEATSPHGGKAHHHQTMSNNKAAQQPYDLQYLDTMVHHHQGAIDMAKMAQTRASSNAIKSFANDIIAKQQAEIDQFKAWRSSWYAGKPDATNMQMVGMKHSMHHMDQDMPKLMAAQGAAFDRLFLQSMIPHHQGAIDMSKPALKTLEHRELRETAQKIIEDQRKEIDQMRAWLKRLPD